MIRKNQEIAHTVEHRRRIYKEAKANCRPCFLGENGHQHASIKDCVADELILQ